MEDNMNKDLGCSPALIEETSTKLKVLGHPIRLKLLCMMERQTACVTDMWQCLDQPQPVISQHLAVLKDKEIVESVHDGNKRIYRVVDPFIKGIIKGLGVTSQEPAGQQV
jgi:DNA-binding transcriptional ArsR family regulator